MEIQGFKVRMTEREMYLGMMFGEGGPGESIDLTNEIRRAKALIKAKQAKAILRDVRVQQVGWLDAARALYQSTILPTLTYSAPAWIRMTKKQIAKVEATQKQCLYEMLELLPTAKYAAVLLEIGLPRVAHFMNQLKVNYVSELLFNKERSQVVQLLWEEEKLFPGSGLIAETREICAKYGLPDVTEVVVSTDDVKETISWEAMYELWTECRASGKIPLHLSYEKRRQHYFNRSKLEAKMMFSYYVGELNLRTNRRKESERKFGGVACLYGICCGDDSIPHIMECEGYVTKPPSDISEEDFGKYLVDIHRERVRRWKAPLIHLDIAGIVID